MENIDIRKVTPSDIDQLQNISKQSFIETYSVSNTQENMTKYLEENLSFEQLSSELNNKNSEFFFAQIDNNVVGYLKLNFGKSQKELKDNNTIEIERIYVLKEFQGKQVGQSLFEKSIEIAKKMNANYIWLGVWEENLNAINFYRKKGFVEFDKHYFKLGSDIQTDIMMKFLLTKE